MEIFSALALTRSFDVYFDLRPNERLSKQWWGWWFETLSRSLWRHRNDAHSFEFCSCYMLNSTGNLSNYVSCSLFNSLRPRHRFADDIFKFIFLNENIWIPIKTSLKVVPKGPINNIPALVQVMAWRRPGDKPLSEPMMVNLLTHICVTRPQWVNGRCPGLKDIRHKLMTMCAMWTFC